MQKLVMYNAASARNPLRWCRQPEGQGLRAGVSLALRLTAPALSPAPGGARQCPFLPPSPEAAAGYPRLVQWHTALSFLIFNSVI